MYIAVECMCDMYIAVADKCEAVTKPSTSLRGCLQVCVCVSYVESEAAAGTPKMFRACPTLHSASTAQKLLSRPLEF